MTVIRRVMAGIVLVSVVSSFGPTTTKTMAQTEELPRQAAPAPVKTPVTETSPQAEEEWTRIKTLINWVPNQFWDIPLDVRPLTTHWVESTNRLLRELGLKFYDRYPNDPRRWEWLVATTSFGRQPEYFKDYKQPFYAGPVDQGDTEKLKTIWTKPEIDQEAKTAWEKRFAEMKAACLASPQATEPQKADLLQPEIEEKFTPARFGQFDKVDLGELQKLLLEYAARVPSVTGSHVRGYAMILLRSYKKKGDKAAEEACRAAMKKSPNAGVRDIASSSEALAEAQVRPMSIKFTALDGRKVDLAKYRGKVVLVQFTGYTWCGACVKEEPFVKAVYEKYHDKGFDIISIGMEHRESDRDFILSYLKEKGITWPVYIDWTGGEDPYILKYGIVGVPQHFLVDKNGLLISTSGSEARNVRLEPLVRKALGLEPTSPSPKTAN